MSNQITASRLLAGDSDIATLEGLLRQSDIGAPVSLGNEAEEEETLRNRPPATSLMKMNLQSMDVAPPKEENQGKSSKISVVEAQIALNRQRLSVYDQIFLGGTAQSEGDGLFEDNKTELVESSSFAEQPLQDAATEPIEGEQNSSDDDFFGVAVVDVRIPSHLRSAAAQNSSRGIKSKPRESVVLLEESRPPPVHPESPTMRENLNEIKSKQYTQSDIPEIELYCQNRSQIRYSADEDFEPLYEVVGGQKSQQDLCGDFGRNSHQKSRNKPHNNSRKRDDKIIREIFSDLEKAVAGSGGKQSIFRQSSEKSVSERLSRPKSGLNSRIKDSEVGKHLQATYSNGGSQQTTKTKENTTTPAPRSASAQIFRRKWYPTPESDIYARSQVRRQQFERKIQKLRGEFTPREEEYSFQPSISFKGRNYEYVPGTLRMGVSRTLQEYLEQKRQECTFEPKINRYDAGQRSWSANSMKHRQEYVPEQFTFKPQISTKYQLKTPRKGDPGIRQYEEFSERKTDRKSVQITSSNEGLTKEQLNKFLQRQEEFLTKKQQTLWEFAEAEAKENTFTPKINKHRSPVILRGSQASGSTGRSRTKQALDQFTFEPKINQYSDKIVQYSGRKPIAQTSIQQFREKQIRLRQQERDKILREYKNECSVETTRSPVKPGAGSKPVLKGDRCW